jgi:hypothetical protein
MTASINDQILDACSSAYEVHEEQDERDDQQNVNRAGRDFERQADRPQENQKNHQSPEHVPSCSGHVAINVPLSRAAEVLKAWPQAR